MDASKPEPLLNFSNLLRVTVWFSLLSGVLEGSARVILRTSGWFGWPQRFCIQKFSLSWGAAVIDAGAILLLGLLLWLVRRIFSDKVGLALLWAIAGLIGCFAVLEALRILSGRASVIFALGFAVTLFRISMQSPEKCMGFLRRTMPVAWGLLAATLLAAYGWPLVIERVEAYRAPAPPPNAPNVLVVMLDTLRADRLGTYGYSRGTSPFLDGFAKRSLLYERAISNASWTLPAHISAFCGHDPGEHGAVLTHYDGRFELIAEALLQRGYQTAGFSANRFYTTCMQGVSAGITHYENTFLTWRDIVTRTSLYTRIGKFMNDYAGISMAVPFMRAEEVNQRFLRWADTRQQRPFFAFLNYMETHFPYLPPQELAARFPGAAQPLLQKDRQRLMMGAPLTPELAARLNDSYDASIAYLDGELKKLFAAIEERGLDKNLLVIILSDHGEALGERNIYDHRNTLYMEEIHVPMIVRLPGITPEGRRYAQPVSIRRLAATIAAATGLPKEKFPGPPLPIRAEDLDSGRPEIIAFSHITGGHFENVLRHYPIWQGWVRSLVRGDLHFILQEDGKMELYDFVKDPREATNLAGTANPTLVAEFRKILLDKENSQRQKRTAGRPSDGSPSEKTVD